jgi:hypothetical protein
VEEVAGLAPSSSPARDLYLSYWDLHCSVNSLY